MTNYNRRLVFDMIEAAIAPSAAAGHATLSHLTKLQLDGKSSESPSYRPWDFRNVSVAMRIPTLRELSAANACIASSTVADWACDAGASNVSKLKVFVGTNEEAEE